VVYRRHGEPDAQLRRPARPRHTGAARGDLRARGRRGGHGDVLGARPAHEPDRQCTARSGRPPGRCGRAVPADVRRGGGGVLCRLQDRRDRRTDLLGVCGARGRRAAGRRRRRVRHLRRRRPSPRTAGVDEGDGGRGARRRTERPARPRVGAPGRGDAHDIRPRPPLRRHRRAAAGAARSAGARPRDDHDGHLHVRDDGPPQGRGARARRVPRQDRRGVRLPDRRPRRRPVHLDDRHGLDHGPEDRGRRGSTRCHAGRVGGRAGLPRPRPAVAARRAAQDHGARRVPDADPGAPLTRRRAGHAARSQLPSHPGLNG